MAKTGYHILYYDWGETVAPDAVSALEKLGHRVFHDSFERMGYDHDERFIEHAVQRIRQDGIDLIFSFNYFPDLSRVAMQEDIRYMSWCYDSPHRVLDSVTLNDPCNLVFLFDRGLYEKYKALGISTVRHMPLACNVGRVQKGLEESLWKDGGIEYQHEISFLGNMYDDEYNFFAKINYLPPYISGYLDAVMEAQSMVFGMDLVTPMLRQDICDEVFKYVNFDMSSNYRVCREDILVSMVQKQVTAMERRRILTALGEHFLVDHYAGKRTAGLPVNYMGYASYQQQMPEVFATSRINLNITLRSIMTGIPLRVMDILGAGGFCITNFQEELLDYFENGESIVWYESFEDLFEKVIFYLTHEEERKRIAAAGHGIVRECFTYEKQLQKMFGLL